MPKEFESTEVVAPEDFTLKAREAVGREVQASVTFKVSSSGMRPLGKTGELGGIAKKDLTDFKQELVEMVDRAVDEGYQRFGEIRDEITQKLGDPNTPQELRARLEPQLDYITKHLAQGKGNFDPNIRGFIDYAEDPVISRCMNLQRQLRGQVETINTVQPLSRTVLIDMGNEAPKVEDLALLSRAVGSSRVDQLLGTNVLSEEKFGLDQNGKPIGISVGVDGVGVSGELPNGKPYFLDVDYSSHQVQKGLYDLEVVDYITGQIDRHPGNIFIDPETGAVKGIDNDLAFPDLPREEMLADPSNAQMVGKPIMNKPLFLHEDTARKIEALRPEDLRRTLSELKYPGGGDRGKLSQEEIEGSVTRLKELQEHVRELRKTGHVVTEFNKETYNEAITHQEDHFAQQNGNEERSLNSTTERRELDGAQKTSYLGSIAIERRANELGMRQDRAERLDIDQVKEKLGTTGKSTRSPEQVEFGKISSQRREELKTQIGQEHQGEIDGIKARLNGYENRLARLEHPSFMDKLRSLRYGGVSGAKEAFEAKRLEALQSLGDVEKRVDARVNERLEGEKPELWKEAKTRVEQAQLLEQARKQEHDLQLREDQKLGVEGTSVEIGKGKEDELVVDSIELDHSTREVEDLKKDEAPELDSVTVESLRDEAPKVSTEDVGEPKPDLQRQGSVRDLMREKGVVKNVKNMFEPDESDKSVRSQVGVRKTDPETQKGQSVKL